MPNVCRHGRPYNLTCDFCRVESKNRDLDFERRSNTPRDRRAKTPDPFRCDKCGYTTPWREAYIRHQNRHAEAGKVAEDLDTAYRSGNVRDRLRPQPPKPEAKPQSHHQTRPNPQRPSGHTPPISRQERVHPPKPSSSARTSVAFMLILVVVGAVVAFALSGGRWVDVPVDRLTDFVRTVGPQGGVAVVTERPTTTSPPPTATPSPIPAPTRTPSHSGIPIPIPISTPAATPPSQSHTMILQEIAKSANWTPVPTRIRITRYKPITPQTKVPIVFIRPTPVILPTSTTTFAAIAKPTATPQPTATPRPTPTPRPTATPRPTPTPTPTPREQLFQWRVYFLDLVNGTRREAGLSAVTLGNNEAAQRHAESMLKEGFLSHWDLDGLIPAMRYTLAGGTNYVRENASGMIGTRGEDWGPPYRKQGWRELIDELHHGLINSPGHRRNILNKWHQKLSLGIACNQYICSAVQNFEGDYVTFTKAPRISGSGVLTFSGSLKGGFTMSSVQVWYHEPPHALTPGQLDATYTGGGAGQEPATFVLKPAPPGSYYSASNLMPQIYTWSSGLDPYSISPLTKRNTAANRIPRLKLLESDRKAVPWTIADQWRVSGASFDVKVGLKKIINDMGPGVYTVVIWGEKSGESVALTNYAVFVD